MYEAVKHFIIEVEGRKFHILTDHKPLVVAIQNPPADPPPHRYRHLDYISQFIKGADNIVTDILSWVGRVPTLLDLSNFAELQSADAGTMNLVSDHSSSQQPIRTVFPGAKGKVWCNEATGSVRPFIPTPLQQTVFNKLHELAFPGVQAFTCLVTERFVWKDMHLNCQVPAGHPTHVDILPPQKVINTYCGLKQCQS